MKNPHEVGSPAMMVTKSWPLSKMQKRMMSPDGSTCLSAKRAMANPSLWSPNSWKPPVKNVEAFGGMRLFADTPPCHFEPREVSRDEMEPQRELSMIA
ncbi:hypothetical protein HL667_09200 [Bradyrhizobium sp. 83012]|uniref:Uncharacterized protein n=1 Tax=Bradyrhizobium aeschynomenes TaxID=2734909 RepID=A0ABX2CAP6_9BRAD|nr:hypothetical protein [Bradyrhizobium aeschynomenes]NPU65168.1 hypothetical protein [Bradyrhizobium aeschynomenes]